MVDFVLLGLEVLKGLLLQLLKVLLLLVHLAQLFVLGSHLVLQGLDLVVLGLFLLLSLQTQTHERKREIGVVE